MVSPYRAMNFVCRQRWQGKPHNRACGALEMHPYSPAGTSPKGKRVTGFSFALRLPTNQVPLPPQRGKFALRLPSRPAVILSASEESRYAEQLNQMLLNTSRREGCRLAVRPALRIIPACHVAHPLPLRGIPLKGTQDVTGLPPCPTGHSE